MILEVLDDNCMEHNMYYLLNNFPKIVLETLPADIGNIKAAGNPTIGIVFSYVRTNIITASMILCTLQRSRSAALGSGTSRVAALANVSLGR